MLKKEYRLKSKKAYKATYHTGSSANIGGIIVFYGINNTQNLPTKFGFVVSKKIHKRAVKRNRIKRLMRECVRTYIKNNIISNKHASLILVATSKLINKDYNYINNSINKILERL